MYGRHGFRHVRVVGPHILKMLKKEKRIGPALSNGAYLLRGSGAPVYLVTNGKKHWITSPATMARFKFSWGKIRVKSNYIVKSIPRSYNVSVKGYDRGPRIYSTIGVKRYNRAASFRRNASWIAKKVRC